VRRERERSSVVERYGDAGLLYRFVRSSKMRLVFAAFFAVALFAVPSLSSAAATGYSWPLSVSVPFEMSYPVGPPYSPVYAVTVTCRYYAPGSNTALLRAVGTRTASFQTRGLTVLNEGAPGALVSIPGPKGSGPPVSGATIGCVLSMAAGSSIDGPYNMPLGISGTTSVQLTLPPSPPVALQMPAMTLLGHK
jgi:hypothetical protein